VERHHRGSVSDFRAAPANPVRVERRRAAPFFIAAGTTTEKRRS
jgi:hypothetical protein